MLPTTPRGHTTSEFWLIVATLVLAIAHAVAQTLGVHFSASTDHLLTVAAGLPAIYAVVRTWLKIHVPTVGNDLPADPTLPDGPAAPSFSTEPAQPALSESAPPSLTTVAPGITANLAGTATATVITPSNVSPFIGAEAPAA